VRFTRTGACFHAMLLIQPPFRSQPERQTVRLYLERFYLPKFVFRNVNTFASREPERHVRWQLARGTDAIHDASISSENRDVPLPEYCNVQLAIGPESHPGAASGRITLPKTSRLSAAAPVCCRYR
jgi:hypothetical protein